MKKSLTLMILLTGLFLVSSCKKEEPQKITPAGNQGEYNPPSWIQGTWRDSILAANGAPNADVYTIPIDDLERNLYGFNESYTDKYGAPIIESSTGNTYYFKVAVPNQSIIEEFWFVKNTATTFTLYKEDPGSNPMAHTVYQKQ